MARYAALLRGVSPMNCKMPELKKALESAGFTDVKTVISSGNAVFSARKSPETTLEKKCEAAIKKHIGRHFMTIVRPVEELEALLQTDPFAKFDLPLRAKRNVTFLRAAPKTKPKLPIHLEAACICALKGREAFTYYVPQEVNATFMDLIQQTFGKEQTTRTWDTVARIVKAAAV